jgi:predicted Zn-dependent protease
MYRFDRISNRWSGMDTDKFQGLKQDFGLLIEAGFIAVRQLDEKSARSLFQAAQKLKPESMAPQIGLGYIALNKLELKEAAAIFEAVIKKEPENYLAQTFLGICYLLVKEKRKEGEKLIAESMKKTTDPTVKNLGQVSLLWLEKDLKKKESKAPFFSGSQETEKGV